MYRQGEREAHLHDLANKLDFLVERTGDRFKLTRTADVSRPVCEDHLTIEQAEDFLRTWKLRGFHGG